MMSKDPAILFYTSDFLSGTTFFTWEQKGQYITLLCAQHQSGHIPEKYMSDTLGDKSNPVWSKFKKDELGMYFNDRMDGEIKKRREHSIKQRENALKRWHKPEGIPKTCDGICDGNANADAMGMPLENGNDNRGKDIINNKKPEWYDSFKKYLELEETGFKEAVNDTEWIKKYNDADPRIDVVGSIKKSRLTFWGTEAGWKHKKKKTRKNKDGTYPEINMKSTYQKSIELNKVYYNKSLFDRNRNRPHKGHNVRG